MRAEAAWKRLEMNIAIYDACAESQLREAAQDEDSNCSHIIRDAEIHSIAISKSTDISKALEKTLRYISSRFAPLMVDFFEDMQKYDFANASSISPKQVTYEDEGTKMTRYKHLTKITLLSHTIRVLDNMIDILTVLNYPAQISDSCIMIALLHDYGKNPKIMQQFSEYSGEPHERISAKYAQVKLQQYADMAKKDDYEYEERVKIIKLVHTTLFQHHQKDTNKTESEDKIQFSLTRKLLIEADTLARRQELEILGVYDNVFQI